jgi:amidase
MPLLIKDNIETKGTLPTTAGSLALVANVSNVDAPVVARLRAAGAVVLGKANLSEWANMRSTASISGWSAVGGQTRNPHALDRTPCGSSAGSGAAVGAGMVDAAIGSETDGSITCPAAMNGIVGLKPTVGLVSRSRIVPISHSQDTAGPMTADVATAARLLTVMAGSDPADPATAPADARRSDYAGALDTGALNGQRIGVMRFAAGRFAPVNTVFEAALAVLRAQGATLIEITKGPDMEALSDAEIEVLLMDFKADLNAYLAATPPAVKVRSVDALIAFNKAHADKELALFGQVFLEALPKMPAVDSPEWRTARTEALRIAGKDGIDAMLAANNVVALVAPTDGPAGFIDVVGGGSRIDIGAGTLAAVAGYPHLTVPMGAVRGMPVGLSFIGPAWSEARLLGLGFAYEQASHARVAPTFAASIESTPDVARMLGRQ